MKGNNIENSYTLPDHHVDVLNKESEKLPDKIFNKRESELTILFRNPHLKTIHHIAVVVFLFLCFTDLMEDYKNYNGFSSGIRLIPLALQRFHVAVLIWIFMYLFVCCIYFCFSVWLKIREVLATESLARRVYDGSGFLFLLSLYVFSFPFMSQILTTYDIQYASATIILVEQVRLLMKIHAFVRGNAGKLMYFGETSHKTSVLPSFGHFIYFTWIPTLVYKDDYPRTTEIAWKKVIIYIFEILACVLSYSIIVERYVNPEYKNFGKRRYSVSDIFRAYLESAIPGAIFFLITFYLVFHALQNLFAELLHFGDRMFYRDWWTVTDIPTFFRKWNIIVHDWLYTYVYKDCYEIWIPGRRRLAKYLSFLLSAAVHEWIVYRMSGFFLPIMSALFLCPGPFLTFMKLPPYAIFNMIFWLLLPFGCGLMVTVYSMEFYARFNEELISSDRMNFFLPRIIYCDYCYMN